jgi:hypothetical protein
MKTKNKREKTINYETIVNKYVYERAQRGEKVTNADIINHVQDETGVTICDSQIRSMVNQLRNDDVILLLLADTKGFFIAQSEKEVKTWVETHEKKIASMKKTLRSIKRQLKTKKAICEYLGEKF